MIRSMNMKLVGLFLISAVIAALGFMAIGSVNIGLCLVSEPTCINTHTHIGKAVMYGMGALAAVFLALIFVPSAYPTWKKFAIWFVPLAAILFIIYPDTGANFWRPAPEQIFQWVSGLYVVVSLFLIGLAKYRE